MIVSFQGCWMDSAAAAEAVLSSAGRGRLDETCCCCHGGLGNPSGLSPH